MLQERESPLKGRKNTSFPDPSTMTESVRSRGFSLGRSDLPFGCSEEAQEQTHNLALFSRTLCDYP